MASGGSIGFGAKPGQSASGGYSGGGGGFGGGSVQFPKAAAVAQALPPEQEVQPPLKDEPAVAAADPLCTRQKAAAIGQPIPVVFSRRIGDRGGVLLAPSATDARYTNDSSNTVTANYHLILGDGPMGSVQVRDVFQCACRVGSFTQTYDKRAGDWEPGNFLTELVGYELQDVPDYCGSYGTYEGMSTMSFTNTYPDGSSDWEKQIYVFCREGRTVTRLADATSGPSSNFADLFKLALEESAKLPADMIDTTRLETAALFLDANELYCDIEVSDSSNLADFVADHAPYFLLRETRINGKRGLRPLLPIDGAYGISTDPVPWEFEFNEDFITPGSLQIDYAPLEQRKPVLMIGMWRQQPDNQFGIVQSSEVGYPGDRESGNVEQHDLSGFCTHELHAVRAMAYRRSRRRWSTHTASWTCRPEVYNRILEEGDIVRLTYTRTASDGSTSTHDYLYQLDQITKQSTGEIEFIGTHFPIDAEGRSMVALDVVAAEPLGYVYEAVRSNVLCDENSEDDTSVPTEVSTDTFLEAIGLAPPLPQFPTAPGATTPPAPPPPGGYPPPATPPSPAPTEPDEVLGDPCAQQCEAQTICGSIGGSAPTCPAGTTNVGTITAHQPDGDQTCVLCQTCTIPPLPECAPTDQICTYIYTGPTGSQAVNSVGLPRTVQIRLGFPLCLAQDRYATQFYGTNCLGTETLAAQPCGKPSEWILTRIYNCSNC